MSWDLAFWKPNGSSSDEPGAVCAALAEESEPAGLVWLSVDAIKDGFRAVFPDIADDGTELNWQGAGGSFQVTWPVGSRPHYALGVFVSCGWNLVNQTAIIERLRSVGVALGCRVFDPQSGEWLS